MLKNELVVNEKEEHLQKKKEQNRATTGGGVGCFFKLGETTI